MIQLRQNNQIISLNEEKIPELDIVVYIPELSGEVQQAKQQQDSSLSDIIKDKDTAQMISMNFFKGGAM